MKPANRSKRIMTALVLTLAVLTFSFTTGAFAGDNTANLTKFQKQLPAPTKLYMPMVDSSGTANTDIQFIADRQAITNVMAAYAYLLDERHMDEWYDLYTDDMVGEFTIAGAGTGIIKTKKSWKAFCDKRFIGPNHESIQWIRRHMMGNFNVCEQTAKTAKVRAYMWITMTHPNCQPLPVSSGTYSANLEKRNGHWKITRWYVELDSMVNMTAPPEGLAPGTFQFIPIVHEHE